MSATATIVTEQAQGVTVPNQAITGSGTSGTVELVKDGKATPQTVVVGLKGSSRSQIVSGLKAGQQVQITITLPSLGTSSSVEQLARRPAARRDERLRRQQASRAVFGGGAP